MAVITLPVNSAKHGVQYALIDEEDLPLLQGYTWSLKARTRSKTKDVVFYVATDLRVAKWKRVRTYLHRILLGDIGSLVVDHIDGNPLNNTRGNLRVVTERQNAYNMPRARGYYWDSERKKWHAQIVIAGTCIFLGRFASEAEARRAHLAAKLKRDQ